MFTIVMKKISSLALITSFLFLGAGKLYSQEDAMDIVDTEAPTEISPEGNSAEMPTDFEDGGDLEE